MHRSLLVVVSMLIMAGCATTASAPSITNSSPDSTDTSITQVNYSTRVVGTLPGAVDLVERAISDNFFYVVSRTGTIERWDRAGKRIDIVLDMTSAATGEGEQGLLGLAFRQIDTAWTAFINFTNAEGSTVISQFQVNADGTFTLSTSPTGQKLLTIPQPYANHNGGAIAVGPDNMVYIGTGDGGSSGDPERAALSTTSLLGKILRINPTSSGYDIPVDNPFVSTAGAQPEIWSIGLRNPWRFNFDSFGNLWVADVGQNIYEEISVAPSNGPVPGGRGVSFGWSAFEGNELFNNDVQSPDQLAPIHTYAHDNGRCSISGSAIGTNTTTSGRAGWYFFADYCSGEVFALLSDGEQTVATEVVETGLNNVSAVRSTSTAMYVLSLDGDIRVINVTRQ